MRFGIIVFAIVFPSVAAAWTYTTDEDRITSVKTETISVRADTASLEPHRRSKEYGVTTFLFFACEKGKLKAIVLAPQKLVGSHRNLVQYKIDDLKAVESSRWTETSDRTGVGLWNDAAAKSFAKSLMGKSRLIFRNTAAVFGELEASFQVDGLSEAFSKMPKSCRP